ncbi:MAG: M20/M25/M40 family metallo-hydrolase [Thermodesulfobacteriota bacterium]|nr:M20/M25/M40 family metallo-hydrolase [Thermodesulfobacteriota bacterium]
MSIPESSTDSTNIYRRPAELLQNLIRFDTTNPPGNEAACVGYIDELLTGAGFETVLLAKDENRPNLITRLTGKGNAPPLLFYGHVDVVTTANQEWKYPPFEGRETEGFIWGRGALDMKNGIAMMLAAFLRAKDEGFTPEGDIILAILCDEEAAGDFGARFLVENHPEHFEGVQYAIGEFGGHSMTIGNRRFYSIQTAEKQMCWLRATVRGPGGHGARPMRGGTMHKLSELLGKLDKTRLPVHITPVARQMIEATASILPFPKGFILRRILNPYLTDFILKFLGEMGRNMEALLHNTVNATIVRGGEKINVIPSEITVDMDGRILPGYNSDDMVREIQAIAGDDVEIEVLRHEVYPSEVNMGLFGLLADILSEADPGSRSVPFLLPAITDGRIFARLGIQTYGFIPMKLPADFNFFETIHAADERIPKEAVGFGAEALYRLIQRYER